MRPICAGLGALCLAWILAAQAPPPQLPQDHPEVAPAQSRQAAADLTERLRPAEAGLSSNPVPRRNLIDDFIFGKMEKDGVPHAPLATDSEFFRRIHLDLTGRTPKDDELRAFLADPDPDKRDKLVDRLVNSRPYEARWTYFFGDMFQSVSNRVGVDGKNVFHKWLMDNVHLDRSYKAMVEDMLTANAISNWYDGRVGYVIRWVVIGANCEDEIHEDTSDELAINAVKHFLGVDLSCVSCHDGKNHLEKINLWLSQRKREELWQTAAFFANTRVLRRTERSNAQDEYSVDDEGPGYDATAATVVRVPRNGKPGLVPPIFMFNGKPADSSSHPRPQLARMLTSDPQFARTAVNMLWKEMFGTGIVDPPFAFDLARLDPKNPPPAPWTLQPTHPELLEALAQYFRDNNHSLKSVLKLIAKSSAYQLSSRFSGEWKASYAPYFARKFVRRMKAEEIHDSLVNATNLTTDIPIRGLDLRVKFAMEGFDPNDARGGTVAGGRSGPLEDVRIFLESFGQTNRMAMARNNDGSITQAILLMNSPFVLKQVKAEKNSFLAGLLADAKLSDEERIGRLFQRFLIRNATPEEVSQAKDVVKSGDKGWEDLQWLLVNKVEFVHNF
jgi:hypothetical protein